MIGLMANSGIKSSQAGTAMRTMFTKLTDGATLTSEAFGEVTVETQNSDGTMRTFRDVIVDLRERFSQMTQAEKLANAETLVGKYAMSGFVSLMNASQDDFDTLYASITDCSGAAQDMADIKMDNLTGSLALMSSAWDAVKTSIGEQFIPTARQGVDVISEVLTGVNDFINENPAVVKGIGAAAAIIGTVTAAIAGFTAVTKVASVVATVFTGTLGAFVGPVMAVTAGVAALTAVVVASADETENLTAEAEEHQRTLDSLNRDYEEAIALGEEGADKAAHIKQTIEDFNAALADTPTTVSEAVSQYEALIASIQETEDAYREAVNTIDDDTNSFKADASQLGEMGKYYPTISSGGENGDNLDTVIDTFNAQYPGLDLTREEVTSGDTSWQDRVNEAIEESDRQEKVTEAWERRNQLLKEQEELQAAADAKEKQLDAAKRKQATAKESMDEAQSGDVFLGQKEADEYNRVSQEVSTFTDELVGLDGALVDNHLKLEEVNEILGMTEEQLQAVAEAEAYAASDAGQLDAAVQTASDDLSVLSGKYNEALAAAQTSIEKQFDLWDKAPTIAATAISELNKESQSRETYWTKYADDLEYLLTLSPEVEGLGAVLQKLGDGSADSANTVAGLAEAARSGSGSLQSYIDQLNDEQEAINRVSDVMAQAVVDVPGQIKEITEAAEEGVAGLDMSEESSKNAKATLQALIDEADSYAEPIKKAYQDVGQKMIDGINAAIAANPIQIPTVTVSTTTTASSSESTNGYASGTENAPPGWAWVGEQGPELINLHGGETILPAAVSQEFQRVYNSETQELQQINAAGVETILPAQEFQRVYNSDKQIYNAGQKAYSTDQQIYNAGSQIYNADQATYNSYASGTDSAQSGLSLVGEYGPELVQSVAPDVSNTYSYNRVIEALEPSGGTSNSVSVGGITIQISSTESGDSLESYVSSSAFSDRVMEVVRDAMEDAARRAW